MKKRSLVAALAMLMVSAIVLTSSTYAWFATGTTAKVSNISAKVANTQGNIQISANGTDYSTSLDYSDFDGIAGNFRPGNFSPVSFNPDAKSFIAGSIKQDDTTGSPTLGKFVFTPTAVSDGSSYYVMLNVYLKSDVDCNVVITPNMTGSTYDFIYSALYDSTGNYKIFNKTSSRGYTPVVSAIAGVDTNGNAIMDANDTLADGTTNDYTGLAASAVSCSAEGLTVALTKGVPATITLYVWAEGNDLACSGAVPEAACGVVLDFAKQG
ncbi:MAG: hypothetical protein IKK49_09275 [Clostridia bacterium]|nr:hypothetical protein [Clostridia bacterium]